MTDYDEYTEYPGDLTMEETLSRLTVEEKKDIGMEATIAFPHLDDSLVVEWMDSYDCDDYNPSDYDPSEALGGEPAKGAGRTIQRVQALFDCLEDKVESGDIPTALDDFVHGYLYPANFEEHGIDPEEFVERDPLDTWDGVYDE